MRKHKRKIETLLLNGDENLRCYKSQRRRINLEKDLCHTLADLHSLSESQEASGTPSRDGNTGSRLLGDLVLPC